MNLPLLRFISLAHRLIRRHRRHLFCFRRAPFFSTFLSVPPISASCSWLYMCSTLKNGELVARWKYTSQIYICISSTFIVIFWNLSRSFLAFKKTATNNLFGQAPVSLRKRMETNPQNEIIINPNFVFPVVHGWFHQRYRLTFVIQ